MSMSEAQLAELESRAYGSENYGWYWRNVAIKKLIAEVRRLTREYEEDMEEAQKTINEYSTGCYELQEERDEVRREICGQGASGMQLHGGRLKLARSIARKRGWSYLYPDD